MLMAVWILILCVLLATGAAMYYSGRVVADRIKIKRVDMPVNDFEGAVRILHLSDLHLYRNMSEKRLENLHRAIDAVYREGVPDLVCLTGDYIDRNSGIDLLGPVLAKLKSKYGAFGVLGNHDYYEYNFAHIFQSLFPKVDRRLADTKAVVKMLKDAGVILLRDGRADLKIGKNEVTVYGLEYKTGKYVRERKLNFTDNGRFRLVLSHYPDAILALKGRVEAMLAGHTHGGQVTFFGLPVMKRSRLPRRMIRGLTYQKETAVYVSQGAGVSCYFPFRLFAPAEIALITMRGKA